MGMGENAVSRVVVIAPYNLVAHGSQSRQRGGVQLPSALIERSDEVMGEFLLVHGEKPFPFNLAASAFTARKQWVLTLPSLQPMAWAVSATSSSSQ